jgi:hypothetical protein
MKIRRINKINTTKSQAPGAHLNGCTHRMLWGIFALLIVVPVIIPAKANWGWSGHEYINFHAVQYLPPEMSFFVYQRTFLSQHAVDPDGDGSPGYYHYIDIDYYPEFYEGTLPHEWDEMLELYDESVVRDMGIVPWVIQWWTDSLSVLMSRNDWDRAWRIAANLGHYVADSHQPLHLTLNYNGQFSGNDGIHSRYIDSVFEYIGEAYANVTWVLLADNLASGQDPDYGSTYYNIMWTELDSITTNAIQRAILDLASIWHTAWVNAGKPIPALGTDVVPYDDLTPAQYALYPNYPNPFNPTTTIRFTNPVPSNVALRIFNMMGQEINTLVSGYQPAGVYTVTWDGRTRQGVETGAGVYFCRLESGAFCQTIRMVYLK